VRRAVALADGDGSLDRRLVAVVEPSGPEGAARDPDALLAHAAERLPAYMLPARVIVAGPLPLTANGKVDRRALAALAGDDGRAATGSDPGGDEPRDELEQRLAEAWATALRLEAVSRTTDFFDAGGDSLLAGKVVGELMDTVPEAAGMLFDELLVHVLEQRTVAALADRLRRGADHSGDRHGDEPASEVVDFGGPGGGPAFVMVHDATGGIDVALGLARALAAHRRTIAVVRVGGGPGAAGDERDGTGIDTLAAAHTRAVTAHGREGPLQVVGYGTGAPLALELARQLGEAGCAVERLCVVDGALPPAGDDPSPFVGDVTLVGRACPEGDGPAWWRDHCLGDVAVVELDDDVAGSLVGDGAGRVVRALCLAPGGA
jgi:pyochelin synthetase